jgi:hypothetical protein
MGNGPVMLRIAFLKIFYQTVRKLDCKWLPKTSVTIREGLPVTTLEQTIADLVESNFDLSLIADMMAEAPSLDLQQLGELLSRLAARNGQAAGDGRALLERIRHRNVVGGN